MVEQEPVRMPNGSLPSLQCPKAEESESVDNSYPKKHFSLGEKKIHKTVSRYLHISGALQFQSAL